MNALTEALNPGGLAPGSSSEWYVKQGYLLFCMGSVSGTAVSALHALPPRAMVMRVLGPSPVDGEHHDSERLSNWSKVTPSERVSQGVEHRCTWLQSPCSRGLHPPRASPTVTKLAVTETECLIGSRPCSNAGLP